MTKIHQETYGSGKPLLLLHGWAMHSGIWRNFAKRLAQHYRVTCIDLPGHGQSEPLRPFELDEISEVLAHNVCDEPAVWLGWSLGATVVLDISRRFPERCSALILMTGNPHFTQLSTVDMQWPGMKTALLDSFADNLQENCQATLLRFLSLQVNGLRDYKPLMKELKTVIAEYPAPDDATLQGGLSILKNADLRSALVDLAMPVMAIFGAKDALVPVAVAAAMQQLAPNMSIKIIDKAGHAPFLSHPSEVVALITDFIEHHV
jgi:pimeloyl-[acyl-carrier protein] methyl ester esterase